MFIWATLIALTGSPHGQFLWSFTRGIFSSLYLLSSTRCLPQTPSSGTETPLSLFCPAIGCQHLHSANTLKRKVTCPYLMYMGILSSPSQPRPVFSVTIHSNRSNLNTHPMGLYTPHLHAVSLTTRVYEAPDLSKVPFLHLVSGKPPNDPVLQPLHQNRTNGRSGTSQILHVRQTRF